MSRARWNPSLMLKIFTQDGPPACLGGPRTDVTTGIVTSTLHPHSTSHQREAVTQDENFSPHLPCIPLP